MRKFYSIDFDKPKEKCGVVGVWSERGDASILARRALIALQHRGQESAGITVFSSRKKLKTRLGMGLIPDVLTEKIIHNLGVSRVSIAHTRYSTTGNSSLENAQPITLQKGKYAISIAHNGNIPDLRFLQKVVIDKPLATSDTALVAAYLLQEREKFNSWIETMRKVFTEIDGAYSLVMVTEDGSLFAVRDRFGIRPLCYGKLTDGWVVASESVALDNIGASFVREVTNGEIIKIDFNGSLSSFFFGIPTRKQVDLFEYIYFSRPDSFINGIRMKEGRKNCGKRLVKRLEKKGIRPNAVIPVFNSGYYAAKGMAINLRVPLVESIMRNPYEGRTFIKPEHNKRIIAVHGKHNFVPDNVIGKKVIFVDDSAVRLTTSSALVKGLRDAGAKEVHAAFASPPVINKCDMGIDMKSKSELPASQWGSEPLEVIEKNIAKQIGADSVTYLPIDETVAAFEGTKDDFYWYPFGGKHPIHDAPEGEKRRKVKSKKVKMLVFISGSGTNLQVLIDEKEKGLLDAEIVGVLSNEPEAYGLLRAKKHGIPTMLISSEGKLRDLSKRKKFEKQILDYVKKQKPELIVLAGWMVVLSDTFLKQLEKENITILNLHPALLCEESGEEVMTSRGEIRVIGGTHAIRDAYEKNISVSGVTVHQLLPMRYFDIGPIILKEEVRREKNETIEEWESRIHEAEYRILPAAVKKVIHQIQLDTTYKQFSFQMKTESFTSHSRKSPHARVGKTFDFIGFGANNIDIFSYVDNNLKQPETGAKALGFYAGGAAANTAVGLAKLGLVCGSVGRLGGDDDSSILRENLTDFRIDISCLTQDYDFRTGRSFVFVDDSGKRNIYTQAEANSSLEKEHINLRYLADTNWLHMSTFIEEKQFAIQEWALRELAGKVRMSYWFDHNILPFPYEVVKKILSNLEILFIKKDVIEKLTGLDYYSAAHKLIADGCKSVAVIENTNKSFIISDSESHTIHQPINLPVKDETGTSCAYAAGFIYARNRGMSLKQSALSGAVMMSFCAEKVGCQTSFPTLQELTKRVYLFKPEKNVLIVGSGGREHALAWKIDKSPHVKRLYVAPGNAGISEIAHTVQIADTDIDALKHFVKEKDIDLTIVGPEVPLEKGIVDAFEKEGLPVFGPSQNAAILESSKSFAKKFMERFEIPTAAFSSFTNIKKAKKYLGSLELPVVIKADGLAAGKGVKICDNKKDALEWLDQLMVRKIFSNAGKKVIIEEYLAGEEASILAFTDGENIIPMLPVQDHKPVYDNDTGPNTGGMGTYAPAPIVTPELLHEIVKTVLEPTIKGMREIGRPYKGILYAGMILTEKGPKVLEFNCRFGDPETQVLMPLLKTDLIEIIDATLLGQLKSIRVDWKNEACVCIVAASGGYPGDYEKNKEILGLQNIHSNGSAGVFHSGTKQHVLTSGGRVLGVVATGHKLEDAVKHAYKKIEKISFDGMHYRKDIAAKAFKDKKNKNVVVGKKETNVVIKSQITLHR